MIVCNIYNADAQITSTVLERELVDVGWLILLDLNLKMGRAIIAWIASNCSILYWKLIKCMLDFAPSIISYTAKR